jgi:phenylalanyl-tRNA synthetase beta chain
MKISFNWLKKYVDIEESPERISEILTDIGLEVEGMEKVESIKGGLHGIVIGKVLTCQKHPNADRLSLTQVDIGQGELLQIVCGAPNVREGLKVVVATVGTTLYSAEGEAWTIKKGKIRGEVSEGMICAEDELGLGDDHSGVIELPEEVQLGMSAREFYKVQEDYVYDIGLTPNRSDATSHYGVAQDLLAYLKINNQSKAIIKDFIDDKLEISKVGDANFTLKIENTEACPRYSGVLLSDIKTGPSPDWLRNMLNAIGIRPINNVVDITNFILHAYGQPLHAFDAEKISGQEVRVKNLPEGTAFLSLDEKERKLHAEDLMICDGQDKPMCIAGVFGGLHSGVTDETKHIFLESAHFSAASIRKTSTRHLLRTEAAKVFEKGSDPALTVKALKKAVYLLQQYAGAKVASDFFDFYPKEIKPREIHLDCNNVNNLLGIEISTESVIEILAAMDMNVVKIDDKTLKVYVPTNKADVTREVDLIEEILRIYGFNNIAVPSQLKTTIHNYDHPSKRHLKNIVSDLLSAKGFHEMMALSLSESRYYKDAGSDLVYINNTSNTHLDIMRPDALVSGLESVARNINHQQTDISLFEFGKSYLKKDDFVESEFLSMYITGQAAQNSWMEGSLPKQNFFDLKKGVWLVLNRLNISGFQAEEMEDDFFEYGLKYSRGSKELVRFGKIHPEQLGRFDIKQEVLAAEFNWSFICEAARQSKTSINELSKFPSTSRDLALVLDEGVKFEEVLKLSRKADKKLITDIRLFDVYKSEEHLGKGKKSYAIKFVFQNSEKTLTDKDVDKVMNKLMGSFKHQLGALIRE